MLNASVRPMVSSWRILSTCICTFSACTLSNEVDVGVGIPSYSAQSIDLLASLTLRDFKYDRRESNKASGHSQGEIPPDLFGFAHDCSNPMRKDFPPSTVRKNTDSPMIYTVHSNTHSDAFPQLLQTGCQIQRFYNRMRKDRKVNL